MGRYQALTREGNLAKEILSSCLTYAVELSELEDECKDLRGYGFEEEKVLDTRVKEVSAVLDAERRRAGDLIQSVKTLTSLERRVLRLRYLCNIPWECICLHLHRERAAVFAAHRSGLNKMGEAGVGTPVT